MVLDTKWTKFKYSNFNKILCVLISCALASVMALNAISLIIYCQFFSNADSFLNPNDNFYATNVFKENFYNFVWALERDISENEKNLLKEEYINDFLAEYRAAELEDRLSDEEVLSIVYDDDYYSGDEESAYGSYQSGMLKDGRKFYKGDDGYYYTHFMVFSDRSLAEPDYYEQGINFGHDDDVAEEMIDYYYCNKTDSSEWYYRSSYDLRYTDLKNVSYYAVFGNEVAANVSDTDELIKSVEGKKGDYICYNSETDSFSSSENLKHFEDLFSLNSGYNFASLKSDFNVFISINPNFSEDDFLKTLYNRYNETREISVNKILVNIIASAALLVVFAVVSCRLAGHKDGAISMAKTDKIPMDLQFILMGSAVGGLGVGITWLLGNFYSLSLHGYSDEFYDSVWFKVVVCAGVVLAWVIILGFAMSLSRAIKAKYPVFKKMLIVKILVAIYKALVWLIKKIGRGIAAFGRMIADFAFRPKKLKKRSVAAVLLYTLINIVSVLIIVALFASGVGFLIFCALLGIAVLLGIDGWLIHRALKYIKKLDEIIEASEKGEPLPYSTEQLPESLKVLADSLEKTNAELQKAVIKAVKDERTKTELITNVSHDLKTPLTSVINYIDLLRKCDIDDENARKYMEVIAEKSGKLKRLIEDLIEASKVSSGNVTINKTMLNLNELAAQAIVEETADIEKNNLQLIFEESADKHIVYADGTKIYRVFENLLSNARKYSALGSRIYAKVYSDGDFGYFEIKNISKEQLNISAEELTERFVRGDQSRSQDGNGLGLSIAKELCRLNNGELILSIDGDLFKATVKLPKK